MYLEASGTICCVVSLTTVSHPILLIAFWPQLNSVSMLVLWVFGVSHSLPW